MTETEAAPNWRKRGLIVVLSVLAILAVILYFYIDGGDGDEMATQGMGELVLDGVLVAQEGEQHEIVPGKFRDEVEDLALEPGEVGIVLHFTDEEGNPATGVINYIDEQDNEHEVALDDEGNALFVVNLTLDDEENARLNTFRLKVGDDEREVSFNVIKPIDNGLTGGDMVNTPEELGVEPGPDQPRTIVDLEVSPLFLEAFAQFCGFSPDEVKKVSLEPNDRQRFQVGWDGTNFVQSHSVIPVGQPIWVLVSNDGDKCRINPPCGNPEVPQGKLPPDPPGKEVPPTPTTTPVVIPSATPPGVTPPPTATPPTATPVTSSCLVTILGPHRVDNTSTHARIQASIQWDLRPNFSATIRWYLDGDFVGGGESVVFMATLNDAHTLLVRVTTPSGQLICDSVAQFAEGSIPPGDDGPGSPPINTATPIPAQPPGPSPTPNDDGYEGP